MKNFIIGLICLVMCSCGGNVIKNVPIIAGAGTGVYMSHDSVVEAIQNNRDCFSPREIIKLREVNIQLEEVKDTIDRMKVEKGNVEALVMELPKLIPLYQRAKINYLVASDIIMSRVDEFSRQDQMTLYSFQATAQRLDASIQEAMLDENGNNNAQTISDILNFTLMVGKIVIPLLIL